MRTRIFTRKERKYMAKLVARNFNSKKPLDENKLGDGLHKPMPDKERMMRLRIRKKSKIVTWDLNVAELAGIIKSNKVMTYTLKNLIHLIMRQDEDKMRSIAYNGIKYMKDTKYEEWISRYEELDNRLKHNKK